MTVMLITHDLGVVAEMAQRVVIMYSGKVVEEGSVEEIFSDPLHPYTEGLLKCIPPRVDRRTDRLSVVKGASTESITFPKRLPLSSPPLSILPRNLH